MYRLIIGLILTAVILLITNCTNSDNAKKSSEQPKKGSTEINKEVKEDCNCSDRDADNLAFKITMDFERSQNELESQDTRKISLYRMEIRPNCSWVATFEISYPFGNTDGWHEPEYIKKRIMCDGVEVYTE